MTQECCFSLDELLREHDDRRSFSLYAERMMNLRVENLRALCGRLPEEGQLFFLETKRSFSAFSFVAYVLREVGRIDHLYIATYSTNRRIIQALTYWIRRGRIGTMHLHVSETLSFRMPTLFRLLRQMEQDGILRLTTAWSHKKVACMQTPSGCFVVEGSGNYGENSMYEQYLFTRSTSLYQFRTGKDGPYD